MKKFLFKIAPYFAVVLIVFAVLGSYADGNTDDDYMHFAVEKPQNIILGDSRGAQGVVPSVLKEKLAVPFDNFSFNIVYSPYGQIYLKALKRKLNPATKNGVFILTVDPWSLSLNHIVKKKEDFPEEKSPLKNMYFYDMSPNYEYLLRNYTKSWFKIYTDREEAGRSNTFLHKDGWLEVDVDMNKAAVASRTAVKTREYRAMMENYDLSDERLKALNDIIDYLKDKGTVYLVRIPASKNITEIENEKFPEFNNIMKEISEKHHLKYYNFANQCNEFLYTDGNHLYRESSKDLSARIGDSIRADRKN